MQAVKKNENILLLMWTATIISTIGSLFYSEIKGFIPCEFCWYQRILMYPLVVIYTVSLIKKDVKITIPGIWLSGIGILVAGYHYGMQKIQVLQSQGESCGIVPCNIEYVNYFGFVTIPFLAFIAFLFIFTCNILYIKRK